MLKIHLFLIFPNQKIPCSQIRSPSPIHKIQPARAFLFLWLLGEKGRSSIFFPPLILCNPNRRSSKLISYPLFSASNALLFSLLSSHDSFFLLYLCPYSSSLSHLLESLTLSSGTRIYLCCIDLDVLSINTTLTQIYSSLLLSETQIWLSFPLLWSLVGYRTCTSVKTTLCCCFCYC